MELNTSQEYKRALLENSNLESKYKEVLEVNHELDRKLVSFQGNKSEPIFRWFSYREGFSKALVEYILDKVAPKEGGVLLDPFAGTGAAPFVANKYKAMNGIAVELLPVGSFFIKCRNTFATLSKSDLLYFAERTMASRQEWISIEPKWKFSHLRITEGAFDADSDRELDQFRTWASQQDDEKFELFSTFVAFSILEKFSYTRKDGQYLRWDHRSPRFENKARKTSFDKGRVYTFSEALFEKLSFISDDLQQNSDLFGDYEEPTPDKVKVLTGSVLEHAGSIDENSIDYIITSPPYCNRYDYTRTYALELAYLGVDEDGIRTLRQELLTCTVENKPKSFDWIEDDVLDSADKAFNDQEALQATLAFLEHEAAAGTLNNKGIKTMVRGYFYDLTVHLVQMSKLLKSGAKYVMVNDNVRYNGLEVPVDLILTDIATKVGFSCERIWVLPKGKGNSSQQMKKHGRRELRKCVYVWTKN